MTDREKVIKAIEYCTDDALACHGDTCPYWQDAISNIVCWNNLMKDALALLKAQEPRVMTLEEVEEGKPYWLEMRGAVSEYAICNLNDHGDSAFLDFATQFGYKTLENDDYGKTWRCWTARPTEAQREAVQWH